jgi:hypothetical protein
VVSHDGNAAAWVLVPEPFDLLDRGVKVIAGMDNEKQLSIFLELARMQIIGA